MILEDVIYTNTEGWKEIRRIPKGLSPLEWNQGVLIGPPDLAELELPEGLGKRLNNALVDAKMIDYEDLNGRRGELLRLIAALPIDNPSSLRLRILGIYQRDFYPELFED